MAKIRLNQLIYPIFVKPGKGIREEISSMPGIYRFSEDELIKEVDRLRSIGINNVLLFGVAKRKDKRPMSAYKKDSTVANAIRSLKKHFPDITVMTDVCLCAYTLHGHCGILRSEEPLSIDNKLTLSALSKIALAHAAAGADYVAPSAMARGQVGAIRRALDKAGYKNTKIMGYSAKFASGFYGPFRDAAGSAPKFGDRSGYQLHCSDKGAALKEIKDDISEGADIVMVKPALAYLDVIAEAKKEFGHILAAYNVSGEYAIAKLGALSGCWREREIVFEIISSIKRAGADIIITYHAPDIARWLNEEKKFNDKEERLQKYAVAP